MKMVAVLKGVKEGKHSFNLYQCGTLLGNAVLEDSEPIPGIAYLATCAVGNHLRVEVELDDKETGSYKITEITGPLPKMDKAMAQAIANSVAYVD